jgi:glyoxylase-like metal-dependent hydrolase (beta-lactamase superfamily II)
MEVPDWQVHEYNPDTYIIRQSGCLDYEKPFMYLLFGKTRALLLDTGSRKIPAASMIENIVGKWAERNHRASVDLLAVHSHEHGDHVAGDEQLRAFQSSTIHVTVIKPDVESTKKLYSITNWPDDVGTIDLGDRVIDAVPIPGHSAVSVALYDRRTGILFSGDSLYPGRLYVADWSAFRKSIHRLAQFTNGKVVTHVLGCHIEQSDTAYLDYPVGTIYQPHEHGLDLSRGDLLELDDALEAIGETPKRVAFKNFTIWPSKSDPQTRAAEREKFRLHQKQQQDQKWDQPGN